MKHLNFNNKTFALVENSKKGKVNAETVFKYKQKGDLVTADYHGGPIAYGKIIAHLKGDTLHMLYQCFTVDNELKAGKGTANISHTNTGKLKLDIDWQWMTDSKAKGKSQFIEVE